MAMNTHKAERLWSNVLWQNAVCSNSYLYFEGTWSAGQKIQQTPPSTVLEKLTAT